MMKRKVLAILLTTVLVLSLGLVFAGPVRAVSYQIGVSQETSPGSDVWVDLGVVDIFDQSGSSAADIYDYVPNPPTGPDTCPVSYRGTVVPALLDTAQMFFVDTSDGLALFVVYDDKSNELGDCSSCDTGDTTGGRAQIRFDLDSVIPGYLVRDDGQGDTPTNDVFNTYFGVDGYAKNLVMVHTWDPPRTDGAAIGPIDCPWTIDVRFMNFTPSGINAWKVVGPGDDEINLAIEVGRMVRLECVEVTDIEVPVDIKPNSCPNPLNLNSKGVLPAAILGTEDFDVNEIDTSQDVFFAPGSDPFDGGVPAEKSAYEDVATPYPNTYVETCDDCSEAGPDEYMDLTLKFDKQDVIERIGEAEDGECLLVSIGGYLNDGTQFVGYDYVRIINKEPAGHGLGVPATANNNGQGKGPKNK
jgi:hypothetical protein